MVSRYWVINNSERALLSQKLQQAVVRWQENWFRANLTSTVRLLANVGEIATQMYRWQSGTTRQGLTVALGVPIDADWGVGFAIAGLAEPSPTTVRGDTARQVETAVLRGLISAVLVETGRLAADDPITWSGDSVDAETVDVTGGFVAAEYQISGSHAAISLLLNPETTAAYVETLSPPVRHNGGLVPIRRALDSETLSLDVIVGEAELLLQELAGLTVGDVLRLDRRIDEPLQLTLDGSNPVSAGHLGKAGTQKAVQLLLATH